tara:strand:+ start:817 stop:1080 length:264 start_codon:yes stop_codon:yes gene_type:complete
MVDVSEITDDCVSVGGVSGTSARTGALPPAMPSIFTSRSSAGMGSFASAGASGGASSPVSLGRFSLCGASSNDGRSLTDFDFRFLAS